MAGLIFGLGIVFVVTPLDAAPAYGRRARDTTIGRRDADFESASRDTFYGDTKNSNAPLEPKQRVEHSTLAELDALRRGTENSIANSRSSSPSSISAPVQDLANSIAELSSEIEREEAYQPMLTRITQSRERKSSNAMSVPVANMPMAVKQEEVNVSHVADSSETIGPEVDRAFQELARLKAHKPSSRSEELSIQMKMQELKLFLASSRSPSEQAGNEGNEPADRLKPRPSNSK
jgi:hypothetical protein